MNIGREIAHWISSEGSFATGVELYGRSGGGPSSATLKRYLQQPMITLEQYEELEGLLQTKLISLGYQEEAQPTRPAPSKSDELPEGVKALKAQLIIWKKKEASLHGQMLAYSKDPNAYQFKPVLHDLAIEMMEVVQPQLDGISEQLRKWFDEGIMPVPGEDRIVQQTIQKMKTVESLRVRISKLNGELKKVAPGSMAQAELEKDRDDLQTELDALRDELKIS